MNKTSRSLPIKKNLNIVATSIAGDRRIDDESDDGDFAVASRHQSRRVHEQRELDEHEDEDDDVAVASRHRSRKVREQLSEDIDSFPAGRGRREQPAHDENKDSAVAGRHRRVRSASYEEKEYEYASRLDPRKKTVHCQACSTQLWSEGTSPNGI